MGVKPVEQRKAEFFALMRRYIQLGVLLPPTLNAENIDEAELVLAEMKLVKGEIYAAVELEARLRDLQVKLSA